MKESITPFLKEVKGKDRGRIFLLNKGVVNIGRGSENDLMIPDSNVSRLHACVTFEGGEFFIRDRGSKNGLMVNRRKVMESSLKDGDEIVIGDRTFVFVSLESKGNKMSGRGHRNIRRAIPIVATLIVLFSMIILITLKGSKDRTIPRGDVSIHEEVKKVEAVREGTIKDLIYSIEKKDVANEGKDDEAEAIDLKKIDLIDRETKRDGGEKKKKRKIPEGMTDRELIEKAESFYASRNLKEARDYYQMAYEVNPACSLCMMRAEKIKKELDEEINKHHNEAIKYFEGLMYNEAIRHWELVLTLCDDPEDERAKKAAEFIERARKSIKKQF